MVIRNRKRLAVLAASAVVSLPAAVSLAQSLSYASYGGPGTSYIQNFNSLPFVIANTTATNSFNGGTSTLFRNNSLGTSGPAFDLGQTVDTNPANFATQINAAVPTVGSNVLLEAFLASATTSYTGSTTTTGGVQTVVNTVATIPVLSQQQAVDRAVTASNALKGWSASQYTASTATNTTAFRFLVDNGGPSNTGSVRSFGPSAQGLIENGVFARTTATNAAAGTTAVNATVSSSLVGQAFNNTSTDTSLYPFLDRALGAVASGSGRQVISLTIRNDSTSILTNINVRAFLETWRKGNTTATNEGFTASYAIFDTAPDQSIYSTDIGNTSTFTAAPTLNLYNTSALLSSTATGSLPLNSGVDGNANRVSYNGTQSVTIFPGQYLVLRYQDIDNQGNDNGVAIDDFTFTATGATVASGAKFLTYNGAVSNSVAVGGDANFVSNGSTFSLTTGDVLTFDNTGLANNNVSVAASGITLSQLTFSNTSGTYTLNGGAINSTIGLIKTGNGTVILNNASNTLGTFGLRASGGTVGFSTLAQIGGAGSTIVLSGGATLQSVASSNLDLSGATVTLAGVGGGFSNNNAVTLGGVSGVGTLTKGGTGTLTLNNFAVSGNFIVNAGTLVFNVPDGTAINLTPNPQTINGDVVLATRARLNLNTLSTANAGNGGELSGSGTLYVDASNSTIATLDNNNANYFTSILLPIVLNRNNVPGFVFNIFPGFAGGSRLQVDGTISGPNGQPANASINFAPGAANGNGSLVLNTQLLYTGGTTINTIGATNGLGGPVVLGINDALPVTTTLGFNTATGFISGSSGSGYLSLGNSVAGAGFSQTLAGLYSGNGDAPLTTFGNVQTAFGGINNNVTNTDPITTQLTLNIAPSTSFTYTGQLLGTFSLIKTGPGTQRLGAVFFGDGSGGVPQTSNYTGTTEIKQGTIEIFGGDDRISFRAPLVLGDSSANTGGMLLISGINQTVTALASAGSASSSIVANSGSVNGTSTLSSTLTIRTSDFNNTTTFPQSRFRDFLTTTYSGTLADGTGQLSLVKSAATTAGVVANLGDLTLTGPLSYSGSTTVLGGKLTLTSSLRPLLVNPASTVGSVAVSGSAGSAAVLALNVPANAIGSSPKRVLQVTSISVSGTGSLVVAAVDRSTNVQNVLETNGLSIDATGLFNLGNNDLILRNTSASSVELLVRQFVSSGGTNGLGTSLAITVDGTNVATLAVFENTVPGAPGAAYYTSYDGVTTGTGDVIVKFTYAGDINLDGIVDGQDYKLFNENLLFPDYTSGWRAGDFNHDGVVNSADLDLLTLAQNAGLPSLGGATSEGGGTQAIPEPGAASLAMVAALAGGLRRRRR